MDRHDYWATKGQCYKLYIFSINIYLHFRVSILFYNDIKISNYNFWDNSFLFVLNIFIDASCVQGIRDFLEFGGEKIDMVVAIKVFAV